MIRTLAERITRGWLVKRTLPTKAGAISMYVSPEGGLRYLLKPMRSIDPALVGYAEQFVRPGDVVWDVGANLGLFTFTAAQIAGPGGRVIAFEPDTWLVSVLRRSAKQQANKANIAIVPAAAGRENALRSFSIADRARSSNHLSEYGTSQTGGIREEQTVPCVSLDFAATQYPGPNVLKIDVEGAECEVLAGAQEVIKRHRPTIILEVAGENSEAVAAFLKAIDYEIFDGLALAADRRPLDVAPWATLALPTPHARYGVAGRGIVTGDTADTCSADGAPAIGPVNISR